MLYTSHDKGRTSVHFGTFALPFASSDQAVNPAPYTTPFDFLTEKQNTQTYSLRISATSKLPDRNSLLTS